jgi:hypothetical protein
MPDFNPSLIAAVDIGSPMTGKLGWAALPDEKMGKDVQTLVALVAEALLRGPVALGFEAPLWVPMRTDGAWWFQRFGVGGAAADESPLVPPA